MHNRCWKFIHLWMMVFLLCCKCYSIAGCYRLFRTKNTNEYMCTHIMYTYTINSILLILFLKSYCCDAYCFTWRLLFLFIFMFFQVISSHFLVLTTGPRYSYQPQFQYYPSIPSGAFTAWSWQSYWRLPSRKPPSSKAIIISKAAHPCNTDNRLRKYMIPVFL